MCLQHEKCLLYKTCWLAHLRKPAPVPDSPGDEAGQRSFDPLLWDKLPLAQCPAKDSELRVLIVRDKNNLQTTIRSDDTRIRRPNVSLEILSTKVWAADEAGPWGPGWSLGLLLLLFVVVLLSVAEDNNSTFTARWATVAARCDSHTHTHTLCLITQLVDNKSGERHQPYPLILNPRWRIK